MNIIRLILHSLIYFITNVINYICDFGKKLFFKKFFSQNYPQNIQIDSVFNADSESDVSFE